MHACSKIDEKAERLPRDAPDRACRPLIACVAGEPVAPGALALALMA